MIIRRQVLIIIHNSLQHINVALSRFLNEKMSGISIIAGVNASHNLVPTKYKLL